MSGPWTTVFPLAQLAPGSARMCRIGGAQVAVFHLAEGGVYAVDNRCPHEGYPLSQGAVSGCTLTCSWHNFKFDLRDGRCLKGDEAVRTFPVRVRDGQVQLDLRDPDPGAALPRMWLSFEGALHERRVGQAVRDAARILDVGVPPAALTAALAAWDGERSQYGATHALAIAWDLLAWAEAWPGPRFAVPLAQLIDLTTRSTVRRAPRIPAPELDPGGDPVAAGERLGRAVEEEDLTVAEGILRGALAAGWGRGIIEPWFYRLCADHFLSFGHRLIYQTKVFDLLDAAGWSHAPSILVGHLAGIVYGTREDLLPTWSGFRARLAELDLAGCYGAAGGDPGWDDHQKVVHALLHGRPGVALDAVTDALRAGAPLVALVDAVSLAAAERMLRFDVAIDGDPACQDTWLSVTHAQTYAAALRTAVNRFAEPDVLRLIYFGARFVNHHRVLDGPVAPAPAPAPVADLAGLLAAVGGGEWPAVWRLAPALIADSTDRAALRSALMELAISDRFAAPIVSAHVMKNLLVAFDEWEATGDACFVLAFLRLLSSPLQQRWTHRGALEAVAFVTEGRVPRLLAP